MLYDARLKFQRDEDSRLRGTIQAGLEQGRKQGRILLLQQMLDLSQFTADEFAARDATQLAELEEQLKRQLASRGQ